MYYCLILYIRQKPRLLCCISVPALLFLQESDSGRFRPGKHRFCREASIRITMDRDGAGLDRMGEIEDRGKKYPGEEEDFEAANCSTNFLSSLLKHLLGGMGYQICCIQKKDLRIWGFEHSRPQAWCGLGHFFICLFASCGLPPQHTQTRTDATHAVC